MKVSFFLPLLLTVFSELQALDIGQPCPSYNGFITSSFTATPSSTCAPYSASWSGKFQSNFCPNQILIHETYNQRQGQYSVVNITQCFTSGQDFTFNFNITPFICVSGMYGAQIYLNTPQETISCWQYTYTVS